MNNRLVHFFLFFASVNIPIVTSLYYDLISSQKTNIKRLVLLLITLGATLATPHILLIDLVIITTITAVRLLSCLLKRESIIRPIKALGMVLLPTIFLSCYWLLPYFASGGEIPDRAESLDILLLLSRNANFTNTFRLISYWWINPQIYFSFANVPALIFVFVSFLLPIGFLVSLVIFRKSTITLTLAGLFTISLFLASNNLFSLPLYEYIMFKSPLSSLGWLLREIDKFGIILAYIYALGIGLLVFHLLNQKRKVLVILIGGLVLPIFIFNFHHLNYVLKTDFVPSVVPSEFTEVNNFLASDSTDFNVVWYPGVSKSFWAQTEDNPYAFMQLSSSKPVANLNSATRNYVNYMFDEKNIDQIDLAKALDIIGVKYLIIRDDDINVSQSQLIANLNTNNGFKLSLDLGIIKVFENLEYSGISNVYTSQIKSNLGYETLKLLDELSIDQKTQYINLIDSLSSDLIDLPVSQYIAENSDATDFALANLSNYFVYPFDYSNRANPEQDWAKASLQNLTHAESEYYLNQYNINNGQLDFNHGIVIATDQFQLTGNRTIEQVNGSPIEIASLSNLSFKNNSITYKFEPTVDQNPFWKIARSDPIRLDSINNPIAISVTGLVTTSVDFNQAQAHLKITFYDKNSNPIQTKHLSPDYIQQINTYFKVPTNASSFDISLWSATSNLAYDVTWSNLKVSDISKYVEPMALTIPLQKNMCPSVCYLFTRSLKNSNGGEIEYQVGDFELKENTNSTNNRFTWTNLGTVSNVSEIIITNRAGFNAINALALIPIQDYNDELNRQLDNIASANSVITIVNPNTNQPITQDERGTFLGLSKSNLTTNLNLISSKPVAIFTKYHQNYPFFKNIPLINQTGTTITISYELGEGETVAELPKVIIQQGQRQDSDLNVQVTNEKEINPTRHQVELSQTLNSTSPYLLTFKKPFSSSWRISNLNNQKPVLTYGIINGWLINTDVKSITITNYPQKYFYFGAFVSLTSLFFILMFWFRNRHN